MRPILLTVGLLFAAGVAGANTLSVPDYKAAWTRFDKEDRGYVGTPQTALTTYDARGYAVKRVFLSNGSQQTQTLTWDGAGRLTAVSHRDLTSNNGYDWTALYDGLGRRLRTVYTPVDGGAACPKLAVTQESWFDPMVEFLEIGVSVNGQKHWKLHGPDLDGSYGGLQGIGGLEAVIRQSDGSITPLISDAFGNVVASVTNSTTVVWNPTRVGGYGPLPGSSAAWLSTNTTLAAATVWRGKRMDPTGYYWQGARYYDPVGGRFLSPDPLGHEASMDLYSYADGDPVNFMDPDGRFGKGATWSAWGALEGTADLAQNVVGSGLYGAMQVADYALGGNDASLFKQYWDNTKAMGSGLAGVAENLGGAGGYWMLRGMDYVSGGNEAQPMQQYWNNVQGMGVGASGGQDRSAAFRWGAGLMAVGSMFVGGEFGTAGKLGRAGEMANATVQAGRMAAKSGGNSFTRFFYDPRPFRQVSTEYWASHGPANGQSLHHWLIPQRATRIPDGIRNAGFNLVQLPAMQGTFHRSLGLNQWMGFARNWGPQARFNAGLVENTIKVGIPAAGAGVGYLGYEVGSLIYDSAFGDK